MGTGPAESVYVVFLQVRLALECRRVCSSVFLHNLKLKLGPIADLIELEGEGVFHATTCNSCCFGTARRRPGNWFHSLPSRSRPPALGERPPHCLKKKATLVRTHWLRISITHCSSIGRARGPLSPPTITQSMPVRLSLPTGARSGSIERKRTPAFVARRCAMREVAFSSSTDTPSQICRG